jgi:hypothetical protein
MQVISQGSKGARVKLLQRMLNHYYHASMVGEDGDFGPMTAGEVRAFQTSRHLFPDGVVGPATWGALGLTVDIDKNVKLFPQPTNMSCWSAAATMLFGNMSVGAGGASVGSTGGLGSSHANVQAFAQAHGLIMHSPMSWSVAGLAGLLRGGPLWVAGVQSLGPGGPQAGHVVVIGAMWGTGVAEATMLLIYDPWPPNRGSIYGAFYGDRIAGSPLMTSYILHR